MKPERWSAARVKDLEEGRCPMQKVPFSGEKGGCGQGRSTGNEGKDRRSSCVPRSQEVPAQNLMICACLPACQKESLGPYIIPVEGAHSPPEAASKQP